MESSWCDVGPKSVQTPLSNPDPKMLKITKNKTKRFLKTYIFFVTSQKAFFTILASEIVAKIGENRLPRDARSEQCDFWRICRIHCPCQQKSRFLRREIMQKSIKLVKKSRRIGFRKRKPLF